MSDTLAAVTQIGEQARRLRAMRRAEHDLAWWGRKIAIAALNGRKEYTTLWISTNPLRAPFWIGRGTSEYAAALQQLLPKGYGFKVEHCYSSENDWLEITWQ